MTPDGLRYLSSRQVRELLPPVARQLELVRETYRAMADGAVDVPAKLGLHPREGSFLHAMPAYLRDRDLVAMKWIAGYATNPVRGLPYLTGLIVLNDSETGLPIAIMDCAAVTAARTAAASALCVDELAPSGWSTAALVGFGVQARAHAAILRHLNPDMRLRVATRRPGTVDEPGAEVVASPREAVEGAEIVVTGIPLRARLDEPVVGEWLEPECLVLPIDYDACLHPALVAAASLFLVDDVDGFRGARAAGQFGGWPEPHGTVGGALADGPATVGGVRVCANLGVGALDAAFAVAVLSAAVEREVGQLVER